MALVLLQIRFRLVDLKSIYFQRVLKWIETKIFELHCNPFTRIWTKTELVCYSSQLICSKISMYSFSAIFRQLIGKAE